MKKALIVLSALLAASVAAAAPQAEGGLKSDAVIAEVNGRAVTKADLDERLGSQGGGAMHGGHQGDALAKARGALDAEIDHRLSLEEFERRGYRNDPRYTVPLRIVMDRRIAESYLRSEVLAKAVPTDAEVAAKLPWSWTQLKLVNIYVPTLEDAEEALAELREGKDFEEVRQRRSMLLGAKKHGGDFVLPGSGRYPKATEELLWSLAEGEISPIIDLGDVMYAIARVAERKELPRAEQEAYRANLTLSLAEQKAGEAIRSLHEGHTLEILKAELQGAAEDVVALRWSDPVVARIDGVEITYGDLVAAMPKPPESYLGQLSAGTLVTDYEGFLRSIFTEWVAASAARKAGYKDPKAESAAAKAAAPLITRHLGRNIYKDVRVTEEEVRAFYETNRKMFTKAEMFTLQSMEFAGRSRAEEAAAKAAKDPEGFAKLREQMSEVPFEARHGKQGLFKDDLSQWPAPVRDAIRATPVGGVTRALERSGKFYVYKVIEVEKQYVSPYENIRWPIYRRILGERRGQAIGEFVAGLRAKATIKIHEDRLKAYAQELQK